MSTAQSCAQLIVLLLCTSLRPAAATEGMLASPPRSTQSIQFKHLATLAGGGATAHYLGFRYFNRIWYQGPKSKSIRWINDWGGDTYLNLDKAGHFMGTMYLSQTLAEAYTWSGFAPRTAVLLGSLTGWATLLEVEMRDAHFLDWGFSIPDFVANTAGATVPILHAFFPSTRALRFKFSYHPSRLYLDRRERAAADRPRSGSVVDDYEGMTFWMTLAVNNLLGGRAEKLWPDFLNLAVGYGATGLHGDNSKSKGRFKRYKDLPDARPEIFLSLDYDLDFLPAHNRLWRYFKNSHLSWIHFPAPAVRVYPEWRFYFIYM